MLSGMRVLSFTHFLQGPAATQYLADMGADIIKVEPPKGAFERHWAGADTVRVGGVSAFFLCGNRNARSLAIDLKHPGAKDVIYRLVEGSDAVVQNFRPGVLDRLGFGYDDIRKVKPDIIYASASGYGVDGPYKDRPGQDLLAQAMSGLVAASGQYDRCPTPTGVAAADQHGGALLALGILGAYVRKLKTGQGCRVDTSLLGAAMDLQNESLVLYYASRSNHNAMRRDPHLATWYIEAPYGIYRAKDAFFALSLNDPNKIANALDSDDLRALDGINCYKQRDRYAAIVAEVVAERTLADLSAAFDKAGIWYGRVENYDDLRVNPQVVHNHSFIDVTVNGEPATLVAHPVTYDGKLPEYRGFAWAPGQDTGTVLKDAGFGDAEIKNLLAQGVVASPEFEKAEV